MVAPTKWLGGLLTLTACLAVPSTPSLVMTHLGDTGEVNPFSRAVSHPGERGRRTFTITDLAVATIRRAGVRIGAPATIFFTVWCASLTSCAIYPTDRGKTPTGLALTQRVLFGLEPGRPLVFTVGPPRAAREVPR